MAAVLHQIRVIDLLQGIGLFEHRLDDGAVRVVDEQHDVRNFDRSVFADSKARRNALDNGFLGRANERTGAGCVFIAFQINGSNQTAARRCAAGITLGQDETGRQLGQRAVGQILLHGFVDVCNTVCYISVLQIDLRKRQAQGGRCITDDVVGLSPILFLRSILVTSDNSPFLQVDAVLWHQDLWYGYTRHSSYSLPMKI